VKEVFATMMIKLVMFLCLCFAWVIGWTLYDNVSRPSRVEFSISDQFSSDNGMQSRLADTSVSIVYQGGWLVLALLGIILLVVEVQRWMHKARYLPTMLVMLLTTIASSGCYRPFEPVKLEIITNTEEGFLIPLVGDAEKQRSTTSEDLYAKSLVSTKQVKIPQQWVPKGFEYAGANGSWQPAAILIKVDRSPITCVWTADPNTGTGKGNEAIWVMTSDQVEFSTGWTCVARIQSKEDCVKFLYNYPSGSVKSVLDTEVPDQPMTKLRSDATPHINTVVTKVTTFFKERGLTITNLGISGGFIYTDKKISDKMSELFMAEQEESIAIAKASALQKTAQGTADAAMLKAKGESAAVKMVAEAKAFEIEKATTNLETYVLLKRLEVQKLLTEKWDGKFPTSYVGSEHPSMLLQLK
jgi:hypothetical protein